MTTRADPGTGGGALPIPRVIAQGGRRGWIAAVIAGALLGGATLVVPAFLSREDAFGFLAILLGMIGAVYLGFVLVDGRLREFRTEYVGLVVFTALAVVGLSTGEALVLAAGYFGHALWDAIHNPRGIHTKTPWWYVPLCLGFDVVIGIYVLARFA
jgi:hypothetical protein